MNSIEHKKELSIDFGIVLEKSASSLTQSGSGNGYENAYQRYNF